MSDTRNVESIDNRGTTTNDPESQQPITATDVRAVEPRIRTIYVIEEEDRDLVEDPAGGALVLCAFCGLVFSWIPIVGLVTFCVNSGAPRRSLRYNFAVMALTISMAVIFFNLIFWFFY